METKRKTGIYDKLQGLMYVTEIDNACKNHLKDNGYYTDNLWQVSDVTNRLNCTDKEAYQILDKVMQSEYIVTTIHEAICEHAVENCNLKFKNDG
jgi:hypothetical protein